MRGVFNDGVRYGAHEAKKKITRIPNKGTLLRKVKKRGLKEGGRWGEERESEPLAIQDCDTGHSKVFIRDRMSAN